MGARVRMPTMYGAGIQIDDTIVARTTSGCARSLLSHSSRW